MGKIVRNDIDYSSNASVLSVNGQIGAITINAESIGALDLSNITTNISSVSTDSEVPSAKTVYNKLESKVDKVSGKGLSTNDYTTTEKTKLAGIAEGATANVIGTTSQVGVLKPDGTTITVDTDGTIHGSDLTINPTSTTEKLSTIGINGVNYKISGIEYDIIYDGGVYDSNGTLLAPLTKEQVEADYTSSSPLIRNLGIDEFDIDKVIIPKRATKIGKHAFDTCSFATNVVIQNGLVAIGDYAFDLCSDLTSVTIPSTVTTIGKYAFSECENLTVTIPNSVTTIGDYAFEEVPHIYYNGTAEGSPWGALEIN